MKPLLAPLTDGWASRAACWPGRCARPPGDARRTGRRPDRILSQRVLGQYDLALLDATVTPRLLLVAPNLAQAAGNLSLDRDELVLWVTIHEITHAVQFSGAPWLREHIGGMLRELIDGLQMSVIGGVGDAKDAGSAGGFPKLPDPRELRAMVAGPGAGSPG